MAVAEYPRVLLVSASVFNRYSGGGIMLTNLFRGWPAGRLATAHSDSFPPDDSVCSRFYGLGPNEFGWMWPFSSLYCRRSRVGYAGSNGMVAPGKEAAPVRRSSLRTLRQFFLGSELFRVTRVSPDLARWIQEFQPEIIYTLLGSLPYIRLVRQLASRFQLPVAIHMMDDWPTVLYRQSMYRFYLRLMMQRELMSLLRDAALRIGICESMCREYERRYGYQFFPFHNALDIAQWLHHARTQWGVGSPVRLVYAGALLPDSQLESLRDVCDIVAHLHSSGMAIEMTLHCPEPFADRYHTDLERAPSVRMCPAPEQEEVASLFAGADLLVLPVNFDGESVRYIRYSMPAKVPAYMVSGTPALVYGPTEVASVRYALDGAWGFVVSERNPARLEEAIRRLATDLALRERLGRRAQALALQNHDAAKVRSRFHEALASAALRRMT